MEAYEILILKEHIDIESRIIAVFFVLLEQLDNTQVSIRIYSKIFLNFYKFLQLFSYFMSL